MNDNGAFRKLCDFQMRNTNLNTFLGKEGYATKESLKNPHQNNTVKTVSTTFI